MSWFWFILLLIVILSAYRRRNQATPVSEKTKRKGLIVLFVLLAITVLIPIVAALWMGLN